MEHPPHVPTRRALRLASLVAAASLLLLAGCGGDDGDDDGASATTPTAEGTTGTDTDADASSSGEDDPANPWLLGYRITTEDAEAQVEVSALGTYQGEEQQPVETTPTVTPGESTHFLFSGFIESGTVTVEVIEGGPVTVEALWGRPEDPEMPIGDIEVREVLDAVEAGAGETVTLDLP